MKNSVRITVLYVLLGIIWIFFSDLLLTYLNWNSFYQLHAQTIKGFLFIFITAILLFFMIYKLTKMHEREILIREEAESNVKASLEENKRYITLFDQVSTGLMITDPQQKENPIIYVNESFESITGYHKKEVICKNGRFLQGDDKIDY